MTGVANTNRLPKSVTPEVLAQDIGHVAEFLRCLESVIPGHVDDDLMTFLQNTAENPLSLQLLAKALSGARL